MISYFSNILYIVFFWLISLLRIIISVIFITLWERKVMSYIGLRKGPKKVGLVGIIQPISDRIKLFIKELGKPKISNKFLFWFFPLMSCFILFSVWFLFYFNNRIINFYLGIIGFLCCISLNVYVIIGGGWGRKRKFSFIGCLRGSAQSISYEVSLIFIIIIPCVFSYNYTLKNLFFKKKIFLIGLIILFFFWLIIILTETNRSPFDFIEGESELVSGFNIEYGAIQFVFLYLAEYGNIIFFCFFSSYLFIKLNKFFNNIFRLILIFFFIWIRSSLPRFRYDLLMELCWIVILPFSLFYIFIVFN